MAGTKWSARVAAAFLEFGLVQEREVWMACCAVKEAWWLHENQWLIFLPVKNERVIFIVSIRHRVNIIELSRTMQLDMYNFFSYTTTDVHTRVLPRNVSINKLLCTDKLYHLRKTTSLKVIYGTNITQSNILYYPSSSRNGWEYRSNSGNTVALPWGIMSTHNI